MKLLKALNKFGFGELNLDVRDFTEPGHIIQLGYEPMKIDFITSIQGLNFESVWENRVEGSYGDIRVPFINLPDLIATREISNRPPDAADVNILKNLPR